MLLSGILLALFLAGAAFLAGAITWALTRRRQWPPASVGYLAMRNAGWYRDPPAASDAGAAGADSALGRHPAGRARADHPVRVGQAAPKGPDDDPEFLRQLSRRISGAPDYGE